MKEFQVLIVIILSMLLTLITRFFKISKIKFKVIAVKLKMYMQESTKDSLIKKKIYSETKIH